MQRRHLVIATFVALGAVAAAACQPVATAPPQAAPAPAPAPAAAPVSACAASVGPDDTTQYFAMVDDGDGVADAVAFDAGSEQEKRVEVAAIDATQGTVLAVEPDWPVQAAVANPGNDPRYANPPQWGVDAAGFPAAWGNAASQGGGVKVALLDTGVHAAHQDLVGAVTPGTDQIGCGGNGTTDSNGHGTHVAGILGMRDNEVGGVGGAPEVQIYPVRVLNAQGAGSYSDVINGINNAVAAGANVISMSLGGPNFSQALQDAVTNAVNAGVVIFASAGNDGNTTPNYPAALAGVISVAATVQAGGLASYSQRGSNVDIAAPGDLIDSTLNTGGYGFKSGTSMAAPFAAAAAALLIAKCRGITVITPAQIESRLESNTTPIAGIQPGSGALRADLATVAPC